MTDTPQLCRALVLHGPQDLRLEQRTLHPPGPSELQVAIRATGLCGSDLHYYRHYRNGDIQVREPISLGHESAGVVVAVGSRAAAFDVGDRVALEVGIPCGHCERCKEGRYNICQTLKFRSSAKSFPHFQGTLQEKINHPASLCYKLPETVPYAVSALLEPLSVAIHASRRAQIAPGTSTLIFGAGTVGLLCAAMSKLNGSNNVIIADVQEQRTSFAVKHGFAHEGFTVPFQKGNIIEEKLQIAQTTAALAGRARGGPNENTAKFDTVFECTGVEACTQAAIYATRPGGRVVLVGMGTPIQTLPISAAALREVDIVGTFRYADTYPQAVNLVERPGKLPSLKTLITHRFLGLENAQSAFETAGRSNDEEGKLVLKVIVDTGTD